MRKIALKENSRSHDAAMNHLTFVGQDTKGRDIFSDLGIKENWDEYQDEKAELVFFRSFRVGDMNRRFMYLHTTKDSSKLQELRKFVKGQGDIYRVTHGEDGDTIWDARW